MQNLTRNTTHRSSFPASRRFSCALAGLALAGLLGACGTVQPTAQQPVAQAPQQATVPAKTDEQPILGKLKNAETVVLTYTQTRKRAATLREAAETARTAALVARHQHSIGTLNAVDAQKAERELAQAQQNLLAGELDARLARAALVRVLTLGIYSGGQVSVNTPAPSPLQQSL